MRRVRLLKLLGKSCVGVVAASLCVLCVVHNVISFLELYGEESVVFQPRFQEGPFEPPAILFLGNDIDVASCRRRSDSSDRCDLVRLVFDFTVRDVVEYRALFERLPRWASKATITSIRNLPSCPAGAGPREAASARQRRSAAQGESTVAQSFAIEAGRIDYGLELCAFWGGSMYAPEYRGAADIVLKMVGLENGDILTGWRPNASGVWESQDGRAITEDHQLWAVGEPAKNQDCVRYRNGQLESVSCGPANHFICDLRSRDYIFVEPMAINAAFEFCRARSSCVFKPRNADDAVAVVQHEQLSPSYEYDGETLVASGWRKSSNETWDAYISRSSNSSEMWTEFHVVGSQANCAYLHVDHNDGRVHDFASIHCAFDAFGTVCNTRDDSCIEDTTTVRTSTTATPEITTLEPGVEQEFCDVLNVIEDLPDQQLKPFVLVAIRGPSQWEMRETVDIRISLSANDSGAHRLVTHSFAIMEEIFRESAEDKTARYNLLLELLNGYSWNFSPAKLDQMVQLSKTESHKPNGSVEYRFKQESQHRSGMNISEAGFSIRWKDGVYFIAWHSSAFDLWTAIATMIGAALMLERGLRGLLGVVNLIRGYPAAPEGVECAPEPAAEERDVSVADQRPPPPAQPPMKLRPRRPTQRPIVPRELMHDF